MAALVASLLDASIEKGGHHYFRFLEVMRNQIKPWPTPPGGSAWNTITEWISDLLDGATSTERARRISAMATAMFSLLADYERKVDESGDAGGTCPEQIVVMLVGLLRAPFVTTQDLRPTYGCAEDS